YLLICTTSAHVPYLLSLPTPLLTRHYILSFFCSSAAHRALHSFPTRRSSDLLRRLDRRRSLGHSACDAAFRPRPRSSLGAGRLRDRKSTRLNSSHVKISYAVFCLKKKR